ncbi:MAG: hypothetical protein FADNKDHG_01296 [Holosporales bacterium]
MLLKGFPPLLIVFTVSCVQIEIKAAFAIAAPIVPDANVAVMPVNWPAIPAPTPLVQTAITTAITTAKAGPTPVIFL